jgi:hypothetical protein
MIPPRPWAIARPQPYYEGQPVYVVDRDGQAAIPISVDPELAQFILDRVNGAEDAER